MGMVEDEDAGDEDADKNKLAGRTFTTENDLIPYSYFFTLQQGYTY